MSEELIRELRAQNKELDNQAVKRDGEFQTLQKNFVEIQFYDD